MAALATVEVQNTTAKAPSTVRISRKVKHAIEEMVDNCRNRAQAAEIAGIKDDTLYRALTKPEVMAYRNARLRVLRESEASRTISRAASLADTAESEHVRLDANKWLGGLEGISPVNRTESLHIHQHDVPGIVINLNAGGEPREPVRVIDGQAHEVRKPMLTKHLEQRVPHPSERNAQNRAIDPPPVEPARGAKS